MMKICTVSHTSVLECLIRRFAFKCFYFVHLCDRSPNTTRGLKEIQNQMLIVLNLP